MRMCLPKQKKPPMLKANIKELNHLLGNIDIYLLDQILKARFASNQNILDAGCGEGRNLIFFVRNNYHIYGIDKDIDALQMLKYLVKSINKKYPLDRFIAAQIDQLPFEANHFDVIISSAVMHFAENERHFKNMFQEQTRVLKPGGILFARMTTDVGIENQIQDAGEGKFLLPDGSLRFLLTRDLLSEMMNIHGFRFAEPFKTVVVENQRSMCTLVLKKETA